MPLLARIGISHPIVQAPMAGTSTPALAAAVSNAGGLGSLGLGASDAAGGRAMIAQFRALSRGPLNVNLFVHETPKVDRQAEAAWLEALRPQFAQVSAEPPQQLRVIYQSFAVDDAMLAMLVEMRPEVISFHFGLPSADKVTALKATGAVLLSTATNLDEAIAARKAGMDGVVAQGYEAGGHRGMFDPLAPDAGLSMPVLTRLLVGQSGLPVIAAGGIMDGGGIKAALALGAVAAQLGTAFILCPESAADQHYRAAMAGEGASHTGFTSAISGRPARCLANDFTRWGETVGLATPGYPQTYDAGKALIAAAKAAGSGDYGAHWAGQGAPLARTMAAADLMATLVAEMG